MTAPGRGRAFGLLVVLALAGCTTDPAAYPGAPVQVVDAGQVASCHYISNFRSKPAVYGVFAAKALEYSRDSILRDAAAMGANTVVFDPVAPGVPVIEITATAYRC